MNHTNLGKYKIVYNNSKEFHVLKREVFTEKIYYIDLPTQTPKILDLGSHIGLSVLYFKQLYPNAEITAFEPNPHNYELLEENIFINNLQNVTLINKAVNNINGKIDFYIDSTDQEWYSTGSLLPKGWNNSQKNKKIEVEAIAFSDLLNEKWDLVKIDVEGVELKLLKSAEGKLKNISNLIIEVHNIKKNYFKDIKNLLNKLEFDITSLDSVKGSNKRDIPSLQIVIASNKNSQ